MRPGRGDRGKSGSEAAETGTTVLLSSHVIADLDNACDHLILLRDGRVRLTGGVDDLLTAHRHLTGHAGGLDLPASRVVHDRGTADLRPDPRCPSAARVPGSDGRAPAFALNVAAVTLGAGVTEAPGAKIPDPAGLGARTALSPVAATCRTDTDLLRRVRLSTPRCVPGSVGGDRVGPTRPPRLGPHPGRNRAPGQPRRARARDPAE
jgi:hypothetical protein